MTCSSGKVRYYCRTRAKQAAKLIKRAGGNRRSVLTTTDPLRPYLCHECGAWHLTSQRR